MTPLLPRLALAAVVVATVSGCGAGGSGGAGQKQFDVAAAFYPLQYATEQVGGDRVRVVGLTKPGAEPHDLELSPKQVAQVSSADLVVYQAGFQPAVDAAVRSEASDHALDVAPAAHLDLSAAEEEAHAGESAQEHSDHAEEAGARDPHFWLDPLRYADVADLVARTLADKDPAGATAYEEGAKRFREQMVTLDGEFRTGLAGCASKELVTSHTAFGYLAERYGLHQEGITGLDPEAEPDPATLARVVAHVRESGARTIYAEVLASPAVARTIARETGARLAVLDPVEGITSESAGRDYPAVMRANLAALRAGQGCP